MDAIVMSPSTFLNVILGVLLLAVLMALLTRNTAPPPTVVINPDPEYLRRPPGVGAFLALVFAVLMVFVIAWAMGS